MPLRRFAAFARLPAALVLLACLGCAQAAEFGDAVVRSHIGQPLVADVELTMLADPSAPVAVRLANPDVYKGANVAMHPALSSLNMSVMRRDGRQFLHITSIKPIDSEYVHLFVELADGGKRNVRLQTLWLTADPAPPAPRPAAPLAPAALPLPAPKAEAPPRVPRPAAAAPAAVCPTPAPARACAAIDYKNGLLSAQIVELEEKVKALELAMKGRTDVAPPAAQPAAKPAPRAVATAAPPLPTKTAAPEAGFPWLVAAAIVVLLAAIGGAVMFVLSRRKSTSVEAAAADSAAWYARWMARVRRKPAAPAVAETEAPKGD